MVARSVSGRSGTQEKDVFFRQAVEMLDGGALATPAERCSFLHQTLVEILPSDCQMIRHQRMSRAMERFFHRVLEELDAGETDEDAEKVQRAIWKATRTMSRHAYDLVCDLNGSRTWEALLQLLSALPAGQKGDKYFALSLCEILGAAAGGKAPAKEDAEEVGEADVRNALESVEQTAEAETEAWLESVCNPAGSHVMRKLLLLAGGYVLTPRPSKPGQAARRRVESVESFRTTYGSPILDERGFLSKMASEGVSDILFSIVIRILQLDARGFAQDTVGVHFLVMVLLRLRTEQRHLKVLKQMLDLLLPLPCDDPTLGTLLGEWSCTLTGSHLVAVLLSVGDKSRVRAIESALLQNSEQLNTLACNHYGNYVIQQYLALRTTAKEEVTIVASRLDFGKALAEKKEGVLWRLAEACLRTRGGMKEFADRLFATLDIHSSAPQDAWSKLLHLSSKAREGAALQGKLSPIGCSIMKVLMSFPRDMVAPLISGLGHALFSSVPSSGANPSATSLDEEEAQGQKDGSIPGIKRLFLHPQGALIAEALFRSTSDWLSDKTRKRILRALSGSLCELALRSSSAYPLVAFYRSCDNRGKKAMVEELIQRKDELHHSAPRVWRLLDIETYHRDKQAWEAKTHESQKSEKFMADILSSSGLSTDSLAEDLFVKEPQTAKTARARGRIIPTAATNGIAVTGSPDSVPHAPVVGKRKAPPLAEAEETQGQSQPRKKGRSRTEDNTGAVSTDNSSDSKRQAPDLSQSSHPRNRKDTSTMTSPSFLIDSASKRRGGAVQLCSVDATTDPRIGKVEVLARMIACHSKR